MKEVQTVKKTPSLHPSKPLAIVVTRDGSEFVKLRALALEAIPLLLRPRDYPEAKREQIAQGFRSILEDDCLDCEDDNDTHGDFADYSEEENEGYEPGECLLWPDEEDI